MTQLMNGFNPLNYDPSQGGGNWPLGKHPVIIESAEVKPTKDNSSGYLQFNLVVIDGPSAGHKGAYRLNLYNQSKDAADIAHRQLSAVCHVLQTFQLGADGTDLRPLFNKPFVIEVGMQKGQEAQEKGYTEIKKVFDMGGNEPVKGGTAQQGGGQTPQGFGGQQGGNGGFGGGQNQQQGQQQGQGGGAQAWGGNGGNNAPANDAQAGQGAQGGGWGQQQGGQNNQQAQGGNGGGWQQQNGGGDNGGAAKPSWGQR